MGDGPFRTERGRRRGLRWRQGSCAGIAGCFLAVLSAALFVGLQGPSVLIWLANGLLLAYLLVAPRWRWPAYFAAGFTAQVAGALLTGSHTVPANLAVAALNMAEVTVAAACLRRRSAQLPRFTDLSYLLSFLLIAVVAAPAIIGLLFAGVAHVWMRLEVWPQFRDWFTTDALGTAVATPAFVAIFRTRFADTSARPRRFVYLILLAAITVVSFNQSQISTLFVIYPLLVLTLLQLGLGWASFGALFVAAAASWYTAHGHGPLVAASPSGALEPALRLQFLVGSAMFMLYPLSVVVENLRSTRRRLQEIVSLHELVTRNSRDVIMIVDFDGIPRYISPAVFALTGWQPRESMERGFTEVAHPEDLARVKTAADKLRHGAESEMVEFRVARRSGGYVWIEASLRVISDRGRSGLTGILLIARDISERKRTEEALQRAYREVEKLAVVDQLTGLANRRRFDECLTNEWRRGLRDRTPLSMILIDVDLFKLYNDTYGHLRGDSCLKQIAESAMDVITRPGDLVARFGGEEFAIILPNTEKQGAVLIAKEICAALLHRSLAHESSPFGVVTISAGCATIVPQLGTHASDLIEIADATLYQAKRQGRNRVCAATEPGPGVRVQAPQVADRAVGS
ncbi:MAG TPA: diguanylate cyclase [Terracidiphilus sp.]|nr:diguanylate cyclase [Terracidiphilus sp.]